MSDEDDRPMTPDERFSAMKDEADMPAWTVNLRALQSARGLTQHEIASRSGVSRDAYARYATGRSRPPDRKLIALASALGAKPSEIDPDRADLDTASHDVPVGTSYKMTPAGGGLVRLELSAAMPIDAAMEIVKILLSGENERK